MLECFTDNQMNFAVVYNIVQIPHTHALETAKMVTKAMFVVDITP